MAAPLIFCIVQWELVGTSGNSRLRGRAAEDALGDFEEDHAFGVADFLVLRLVLALEAFFVASLGEFAAEGSGEFAAGACERLDRGEGVGEFAESAAGETGAVLGAEGFTRRRVIRLRLARCCVRRWRQRARVEG